MQTINESTNKRRIAIDICTHLQYRGFPVAAGQCHKVWFRHDDWDLYHAVTQLFVAEQTSDFFREWRGSVLMKNKVGHGVLHNNKNHSLPSKDALKHPISTNPQEQAQFLRAYLFLSATHISNLSLFLRTAKAQLCNACSEPRAQFSGKRDKPLRIPKGRTTRPPP